MAKQRQENPADESARAQAKSAKKKRAAGQLPWHPIWRWSISCLVVLHLTAVICAPWSLSTGNALPPNYEAMRPQQPLPPPDSVVWQKPVVPRALHDFFHHYLNLLYLNHGYEFFAPDPAGTHVIDYQVTAADGNVIEGRLPSHETHWPRLLYHRHMMLAEQTQLMGPQSGQLYADHLATLHDGASQMQLKVHTLLPPHRVADGTPLDAPSTFRTIGTVTGRPRPGAAASAAPSSDPPASIPGAQ